MFDLSTRILIVDDMRTMRLIVAKTCKQIGFTDITEAADGVLAWQEITNAKVPFGLIISDWNMPNCTGLDLLKRVRGDQRIAETPFILVTAESEKSQIVEAIQAKVSGYVVKPFTTESLSEKLAAVHASYTSKK